MHRQQLHQSAPLNVHEGSPSFSSLPFCRSCIWACLSGSNVLASTRSCVLGYCLFCFRSKKSQSRIYGKTEMETEVEKRREWEERITLGWWWWTVILILLLEWYLTCYFSFWRFKHSISPTRTIGFLYKAYLMSFWKQWHWLSIYRSS